MGLENGGNLLVLVQLPHALGTLVYFLGMVGIIGKKNMLVVLYLKVKTAVHSSVCLHSVAQFFSGATAQLGHCHCRYAVFNIDGNGLTKLYVGDIFNGRNKVKGYFAILDLNVFRMKVALIQTILDRKSAV